MVHLPHSCVSEAHGTAHLNRKAGIVPPAWRHCSKLKHVPLNRMILPGRRQSHEVHDPASAQRPPLSTQPQPTADITGNSSIHPQSSAQSILPIALINHNQ